MNEGVSLLPELSREALVPVLLVATLAVLILLRRALARALTSVCVGAVTTLFLFVVLDFAAPLVGDLVSTTVVSPGPNGRERLLGSLVVLILTKGVLVSVISVIDTSVPDGIREGDASVFDETEVQKLVETLAYWSIFTLALLDGPPELVLATMGAIVGTTLDLLNVRLSRIVGLISRPWRMRLDTTGLARTVALYLLLAAAPVVVLTFGDATPLVVLTAVGEVEVIEPVVLLLTSKFLIEGLSGSSGLEPVLYLSVFAVALVDGSTNLAFAFAGMIVEATMQNAA